ncbi:hypothetical protein D9611_006507 [Ephemerocybe angulata]|uniref:R3H domain-containing protein n=1 Tax=Ephemerocybe angulata TaxID=980116 RepID=A0A8H5C9D0_9AGAR|nr:hypothetical protein D9611_006507 [Tulosesus angulatus]
MSAIPQSSVAVEESSSSNPNRRQAPRRRRPRRTGENAPTSGPDVQGAASNSVERPGPPRAPRQPRRTPQGNQSNQGDRPPKPRAPRPQKPKDDSGPTPGASRRSKFRGRLTNVPDAAPTSEPSTLVPDAALTSEPSTLKPSEKYRTLPQGDDLTSSLIRQLSTPPYPDCPICFASIHPAQPIWSCSPSTPVVPSSEGQVHYCWTSFHTKCIKAWAAKSVKEMSEAWRARGDLEKVGDWRCPGCQAKREVVPSGYWCFCNTVPEPKLTRLSTPHSCGKPCSRVRDSGCGHPCPLLCHPGPCPPCQVVTQLDCYCPRHISLSFRCGVDIIGNGKRNLSCGNVCGRVLGCGNHNCTSVCHEGDCAKCLETEVVKCYCGKEEKQVACGDGTPKDCFVEGEEPWIGRYTCDNTCERPFDCGIHQCEKACHPPSSKPAICPRSPRVVTHCPCGKGTIAPPGSDSSQYTFPARPNCEAPIPTCASVCSKPHPQCSHPCETKCHLGPCPPCTVTITRPCRCGATTRRIPCYEVYEKAENGDIQVQEILCDRPCTSLRACGRHQCRRICCPLASLATAQRKGKKRAMQQNEVGIGEERGGLHECDLVCAKMLSCGNHRCEERDHKGPCPPCLRSSFEEMFCPCGRTVLEPPVPCGTRIQCNYPCPRPSPPCGHPKTPHACHDDSLPCPPCPHLTTKQCACGKKEISNVKCSLEKDKVSCGTVCGKLMSCGFHHCESLCHGGDCGTCTAPCGKARKLCFPNHHPCTRPCHAPSACPETEPCEAIITITCPCGRIKQAVQCGRRVSHPSGHQVTAPKCINECSIAKRNARLAEALGIDPASKDKDKVVYNDELVAFARANPRFLSVVEKAFSDFISSDKRHQVLPHMPPEKRKIAHDLANIYRMDTQLIDQEPQRSVQLIRRIDTRIPSPVLSAYIASLTPNFGRLADLRSLKSGSSSPVPRSGAPTPTASSSSATTRGWGSVAGPSRPIGHAVVGSVPPSISSSSSSTLRPAGSGASMPRNRSHTEIKVAVAKAQVEQEEGGPVVDNWEDDL